MPSSFNYYTYPSNLTEVKLDLWEVSDAHLVEVAIGPENYGYIVTKMELPSRRMHTQVDGQLMTHTYWGTVSFSQICPVKIYPEETAIVTQVLYTRSLKVTNTSNQVICVNETALQPGDQLIKLVYLNEVIYAKSEYGLVELDLSFSTVSP